MILNDTTNEKKGVFQLKMLYMIGGKPSEAQPIGKATCAVSFNAPDRTKVVAVGSTEGVWVGWTDGPSPLKRILELKNVKKVAVHEDIGAFFVLADKFLYAYHIEGILPSSPPNPVPQIVKKSVHYFSVGSQGGKSFVVCAKSGSLSTTVYVLEAVIDGIKDAMTTPPTNPTLSGLSHWFRPHREFYIPLDTHDYIFLKTKSAIFASRTFEILDLERLETVTIPSQEDLERVVSQGVRKQSRPIGMFKVGESEFLLCYTCFGLYVEKQGAVRGASPVVEWGISAERVVFCGTYILLFGSQSVQVRELSSGQLVQDIQGRDIHCLWDGRTARDAATRAEDEKQTTSAIGIMQVGDAQQIFEIVPV